MEWLNRIGMILGFLSFWLVAPEFIGEERLRRWEERLEAFIARVPAQFGCLFGLFMMLMTMGLLLTVLEPLFPNRRYDPTPWNRSDAPPIWQQVALTVSLGVGAFVGWQSSRAMQWLVRPLLSRLANDDRIRDRWFWGGVWLFVISFVFQFIATFAQPTP
jgi:hypothetical protein